MSPSFFFSRVQSLLAALFVQHRPDDECLLADPEVIPARMHEATEMDDIDWLTLARGL
jgi:hypothetical protein